MKYFVLLTLSMFLLCHIALAEPLPLQWDEPGAQAGLLEKTCVYIVVCPLSTICTLDSWRQVACLASDDKNGGDTKSYTVNIPIYEGDLPLTVRYTVTSVNTSGNETTKGDVSGSHTFTAP